MTLVREDVYAALWKLACDDVFITQGRKLKHWSDVPQAEMPALFMAQGNQIVMPTEANGLPARWMLEATLYLYVSTQGEQSPGEVLNPILDTLTGKFDPNPMGTPQTLGGLVKWARIEGTIETSEGTLGDLEVAMVPIKMLTA